MVILQWKGTLRQFLAPDTASFKQRFTERKQISKIIQAVDCKGIFSFQIFGRTIQIRDPPGTYILEIIEKFKHSTVKGLFLYSLIFDRTIQIREPPDTYIQAVHSKGDFFFYEYSALPFKITAVDDTLGTLLLKMVSGAGYF